MIVEANAKISCPVCSEEWEGVAEDYVLADRTGSDSQAEEQCVGCDEMFVCTRLQSGQIEVFKIDSEEDDGEDD